MANDSKRKTDSGGTRVRWVQVGATVSLGLIGLVFTFVTKNQMERSSVTLSALQLMGQRENSELALRQDVFKKITDSLLNKETEIGTRIVLFELFQHNFHNVFNSRVLFDLLAKEAAGEPALEKKLVSLAKEIKRRQVMLVGVVPVVLDLRKGERAKAKYDTHSVSIELLDVRNDSVLVEVVIGTDKARRFKVSYFDAPLADNTLLPDRHRFAVMLDQLDVKKGQASLSVLHFPAYFVTMGYRPSILETRKLLDNVHNGTGEHGH